MGALLLSIININYVDDWKIYAPFPLLSRIKKSHLKKTSVFQRLNMARLSKRRAGKLADKQDLRAARTGRWRWALKAFSSQ